MPPISRFGRKRVMSRRADEATRDHNTLFFNGLRFNFKSITFFLFQNLIDPADLHRYDRCDHCGEGKRDYPSGGKDFICKKCYDHYSRPQEEGESDEDYRGRLPEQN